MVAKGEENADEENTCEKPNKDVASMMVKDVMEKRVQFARLNTKGDVIARS